MGGEEKKKNGGGDGWGVCLNGCFSIGLYMHDGTGK